MRPPRGIPLGFVDTRIGPACKHACGLSSRKRLICQARSSTIPARPAPTKPVDEALTAGQSVDIAFIEHTAPDWVLPPFHSGRQPHHRSDEHRGEQAGQQSAAEQSRRRGHPTDLGHGQGGQRE